VFQREQAPVPGAGELASSASQLLARARQIIERVEDATLKRALSLLIPGAAAPGAPAPDATALQPSVAAPPPRWFDQAMDRAGGWYKRQAQALSIAIGFVVAVAANADVLHVASRLWNDASLRASVTAAAEAYHTEHAGDAKGTPADDSLGR